MRATLTCPEAQEKIAAYRSGWLPASEAGRIREHLQACTACAREADRDAVLCLAFELLPAEAPVMPARVAASEPVRRPVRRLSLAATAVAAALALVLFARHGGLERRQVHPVAPVPTGAASGSVPATWADAHDVVSLSDAAADPNRVMVLLYAGRERGARQ